MMYDLSVLLESIERTHELLPCGQQGSETRGTIPEVKVEVLLVRLHGAQ